MKVDTRKFASALRLAIEHTSSEIPDVINKAAIDVIITAAKLTRKADPGRIEQSLTKGVIPVTGRKKKDGSVAIKNVFVPKPIVYMIINANRRRQGKPGLNNSQMSKAAQALIRKRKQAIGFTAYAGWQKALLDLGGHGFGSSKTKMQGINNTSARGGRGEKATSSRMIAKMVNTATACEIYGRIPLQEALDIKERDIRQHVKEKLDGICRQASRNY